MLAAALQRFALSVDPRDRRSRMELGMIYGLYLSTAGAKAQNYRQDVVSNNIANASTTGFRQQFSVFRQRASHDVEWGGRPPTNPADLDNLDGGLHMYEAPSDMKGQGAIRNTNRALDVAINGEGFFQVRRGTQTFLTRNGSFALDARGFLTTSDGSAQVMTAQGTPLQLDGNQPVAIEKDGRVFQNDAPVGQIGLFNPLRAGDAQRVGDSLFAFNGGLEPAKGNLQQNFLEGANVNPINEMVALIETSRAFQMNINMIQLQSDGLSTLLQTVPRLPG